MIIESEFRDVNSLSENRKTPTEPLPAEKSTKPSGKEAELLQVLVIDDEPAIQRLIQQTLEPNATVLQEFGLSKETEAYPLEEADLVILDYKMPGVDGLDLLHSIRKEHPKLPILFMTGFGDLSIASRAIEAGASEYLPKPFNPDDLRAAVSRWLPEFGTVSRKPADEFVKQSAESILTESQNFLVAYSRDSKEIRGRVVRFNSRAVVVEIPLASEIIPGTELPEAIVTLGSRSMEVANARIQSVSLLVDRALVEIGLSGIWQVEEHEEEELTPDLFAGRSDLPNDRIYTRFSDGLAERDRIPAEVRAPVLELAYLFQEIADDLNLIQSKVGEQPSDHLKLEEDLIEDAKARFFPAITEAIGRFEWAAEEAERNGLKEEYERFAQKGLFPHLLCSPFFSRIVEKPIGVPGDYDMLGQMLGNRFQGHSLFARILNGWVLHSHPAKAYRHRVALLNQKIDETIEWSSRLDEEARILSVGSGVAYEVQKFVQDCDDQTKIHFELEDFSRETLEEALRQFDACQQAADPDGVRISFRQSSVIELANQARESRKQELPAKRYHLVYCAGLYDYLSDRMCRTVTNYLYDLVEPGGQLIISNFTPSNQLRNLMTFVLDWELIYRTVDHFSALMKKTQLKGNFEIVTDKTGTELYAIAKKS